jgi:hypothetical protein
MNVILDQSTICLYWKTILHYDLQIDGLVTFTISNDVEACTSLSQYFTINFLNGYDIFNAIIFLLALFEVFVILRRVYRGVKTLMQIKQTLNDQFNEDNHIHEADSFDYNPGVSKWEMLKLKDKKLFVSLWYFLFLTANFFQILSSLANLMSPLFSYMNQVLTAFACMLTWFSVGYFFQFQDKYSFIYLTLERSIKYYKAHIVVCSIQFIGLGMLVHLLFPSSQFYYSSLHMTYTTLFANMIGDALWEFWSSTFDTNPLTTIILCLYIFVFYVSFSFRLLMVITEDAFDSVKMRNNYYWLDKKIGVLDYISNNMQTQKGEEGEDDNRYMMRDVIMKTVMETNENYNREKYHSSKIQDYLILDTDKLMKAGFNKKYIEGFVKKEFKKLKAKHMSKGVMQDLFKHNFSEDPNLMDLTFGKSNAQKVNDLYEMIELLFKRIHRILHKINTLVYIEKEKNFKFLTKEDINEIYALLQKQISKLRKRLNRMKRSQGILSKSE